MAAIVSSPLLVRDAAAAVSRGRFDEAARTARLAARTSGPRAEKVVSRRYRCLWLCNPKVASRSIMAALRGMDPDAEFIYGKSISDVCATHPEAGGYYSFAFVRHPFERALSLFAEMRFRNERFHGRHRRLKEERQRYFSDAFPGLGEIDGFDDFCRWLNTPYGSDAFADVHFLSQHVQIRLADGRLPDFVGRFENVDEDLRRVAARLGMPAPVLPMLNTRAGWRPPRQAVRAARAEMSGLLTDRNKALLRTRYAADLELWRNVAAGREAHEAGE